VSFSGAIGLKADKARGWLQDVRQRIRHTDRLLADAPIEDRARVLCAVVNRACDPSNALSERAAATLRYIADDRRQLKAFDYTLALDLAQRISAQRGVRAFRHIAYRDLRLRFGLRSLVTARHRAPQPKSGDV
jgi:hypothetical protein